MALVASTTPYRLGGADGERVLSENSDLIPYRIHFVRAKKKDDHLGKLREKYTPVNRAPVKGRKEEKGRSATKEKASGKETAKSATNEMPVSVPAVPLFPEERVREALHWTTRYRIGSGLNNVGNTCFLNASLQCLVHLPPLVAVLLKGTHTRECRVSGFCSLCGMTNHIRQSLSGSSRVPITPKAILRNLRVVCSHFRIGRQEDAHEFIRHLVDSMQDACVVSATGIQKVQHALKRLGPGQATSSIVHCVFGGVLQSTVKCGRDGCRYESNKYDDFLDLSLELKGAPSVAVAFRKFCRPEVLSADNQYRCDRCKQLSRATKCFRLYRTPNVLVLHLKRFHLFGGKIKKHVQFEPTLTLSSHLTKGVPGATSSSDATYDLVGVLVHSGYSADSGHYFSFVKGSTGTWYRMDDSHVSQISLQRVLQQEAYMLFYTRRPAKKKAVASSSEQEKMKAVPASFVEQEKRAHPAHENGKRKKIKEKKVGEATKEIPLAQNAPVKDKSSPRKEQAVTPARGYHLLHKHLREKVDQGRAERDDGMDVENSGEEDNAHQSNRKSRKRSFGALDNGSGDGVDRKRKAITEDSGKESVFWGDLVGKAHPKAECREGEAEHKKEKKKKKKKKGETGIHGALRPESVDVWEHIDRKSVGRKDATEQKEKKKIRKKDMEWEAEMDKPKGRKRRKKRRLDAAGPNPFQKVYEYHNQSIGSSERTKISEQMNVALKRRRLLWKKRIGAE